MIIEPKFKRKIVKMSTLFGGRQQRVEFDNGLEVILKVHKTRGLVIPRRMKVLYRKMGLID